MDSDYEPVEQGHYRMLNDEYRLCQGANLSLDELLNYTSHSVECMIDMSTDKTHFIAEGLIPADVLWKILNRVESKTMDSARDGIVQFKHFTSYNFEQLRDFGKRPFIESFFKDAARKIKGAKVFEHNERYLDMAKWILNNYDRWIHFDDHILFFDESDRKRKIQAFVKNDFDPRFPDILRKFIDFYSDMGYHYHSMMYLGTDVPLLDQNKTDELIDRFYNCVKGLDRKNFRQNLDGEINSDKLKALRANFDSSSCDKDTIELKKLACMANEIYLSELRFMYQGATSQATLILPRWVITLEEEFAGNWSGSFHPLLYRGCNASAYREEAHYVKYHRC
jgi:hypothetical protein